MADHNDSGVEAEERVIEYLKDRDYKVLDNNWKTKWCEIDIVAKKEECIYFVEVKYRKNAYQGGGFDYITPKKLRQMDLAARSWVEINKWGGGHTMSVAEVSGDGFDIEFIEDVTI